MTDQEIQELIDDVTNSYETQIAILREDMLEQIDNLYGKILSLEKEIED